MPRRLMGLLALLLFGRVATAAELSFLRVVRAFDLSPETGFVLRQHQVMRGLLLPVPRLGFVSMPIDLWECDVRCTLAGAPAGAPQVRLIGRFITLAD